MKMIGMLWRESYTEFLKLLRTPGFSLPAILFPVMFYLMFGVALGGDRMVGDVNLATYLLASYGCFGLLGTCMFGFGVSLAIEREQGWLTAKRVTPMPGACIFFAKTAMSLVFGAIILALLAFCGVAFAGVRLAAPNWLMFASIALASVVPFSVLGLIIGFSSSGKASPAIANLIYLPLSLASGLWLPIEALPKFFQHLAPALPPYHLNQLLLAGVGFGDFAGGLKHLLYLSLFSVVGFLIVAWLYRRNLDSSSR